MWFLKYDREYINHRNHAIKFVSVYRFFLDIKNVRTGCEDAYLGEIFEYVCVHATNKQH